jgi:hypothetical protein
MVRVNLSVLGTKRVHGYVWNLEMAARDDRWEGGKKEKKALLRKNKGGLLAGHRVVSILAHSTILIRDDMAALLGKSSDSALRWVHWDSISQGIFTISFLSNACMRRGCGCYAAGGTR